MKYLALIYSAADWEADGTTDFAAVMAAYQAFEKKYSEQILGGEALEPVDAAVSLRVRQNEVVRTDGPFAETKEVLGGFYMLECANFEEALSIASEIPGAAEGIVEVRPVMVLPEM